MGFAKGKYASFLQFSVAFGLNKGIVKGILLKHTSQSIIRKCGYYQINYGAIIKQIIFLSAWSNNSDDICYGKIVGEIGDIVLALLVYFGKIFC